MKFLNWVVGKNSLLSLLGGLFLTGICFEISWSQNVFRVEVSPTGNSEALAKVSKKEVSQAIVEAAKKLRDGDALILPTTEEFGIVKMPKLPQDVQILGGTGDEMQLVGLAKGTIFHGGNYNLDLRKHGAALENSYFIERKGSITGGDFENTYWISNIGSINIDGTMRNCTGVWMRYNHEGSKSTQASYSFKLNGSGQNVRIIQMVEHNQGNRRPALYVENARGMKFAHGSTEGSSGYPMEGNSLPLGNWVYKLKECENVYLGHRRFFSGHPPKYKPPLHVGGTSWVGYPAIQLWVEGGKGNILDNIVDIGNSSSLSLLYSDPKMQAWSTIWEDPVNYNGNTIDHHFQYSFTWEGIKGVEGAGNLEGWQEPRSIDDENVLYYFAGTDSFDLTEEDVSLPEGHCIPAPPLLPTANAPKPPELLYKRAKNFGAALIAAGADPTGTRSSNAAFEAVLRRNSVVEVPPGNFLIDGPLKVGGEALRKGEVRILGSGEEKTKLFGYGSGSVLSFQISGGGLAKGSGAQAILKINLENTTIDGKEYGVMLSGHNNVFLNVTFKNNSIAGAAQLSSEAEQHRFIGCKFIGGEYGVRFDTYQDKPLFYRCHFEGQSKGGIYCTKIVHFHGGVYQSTFKNINGPGVAIYGGNPIQGYGPWIISIDGCTFEECGNETEAALDLGYNWLGAVLNTSITTQKKTIKTGFRGNFGVLQDLNVNVKAADNKALYLGHQRYEKTAGIGGARLMNVDVNGGDIYFMPYEEAMTYQHEIGKADLGYQKPGLYSNYEYAFTYMFYNVQSGNYNVPYAMINNGEIAVDMSKFTNCSPLSIDSGNRHQSDGLKKGIQRTYDLKGRLLKIRDKASAIPGANNSVKIPVN